jgi:hypothetical protein
VLIVPSGEWRFRGKLEISDYHSLYSVGGDVLEGSSLEERRVSGNGI